MDAWLAALLSGSGVSVRIRPGITGLAAAGPCWVPGIWRCGAAIAAAGRCGAGHAVSRAVNRDRVAVGDCRDGLGGTHRAGSGRGRPRGLSCLVTAAGDRVRAGERGDMGVAALISWLVIAFFGLYLLAVWLIEYDVSGEGAPASRLPTPVILGHVVFALTGVVFWVIHLLSHASTQGWAAVGILAV